MLSSVVSLTFYRELIRVLVHENKQTEKLYLQNTDLTGIMPEEVCGLRRESNGTLPVLEVANVGCDVECDRERGTGCCTNQC